MYSCALIRYMLDHVDASANEKLILIALARYTDAEGRCFPSIPTIQRVTGLSRSSVIRGINKLVDENHLARIPSMQRSTTYQFTVLMEDQPMAENSVTVTPEDVVELDTSNIVKMDRASILPTSGVSMTPSFDSFWSAYPRKIAKGHARLAFQRAAKKADPAVIIAAVHKFASLCEGKEKQYIPHAATWLNGERWEDDLDGETSESLDWSIANEF